MYLTGRGEHLGWEVLRWLALLSLAAALTLLLSR